MLTDLHTKFVTFFVSKKGLVALLFVVVLSGLALSQRGSEKVELEKDDLECQPVTGEYCKKRCEPFKVSLYKPGYYLAPAANGGRLLYTSCYKGSEEPAAGALTFACSCHSESSY